MLVVQCDFDDTITVGNVSAAIRKMFGPKNWKVMEDEYLSGRYSVEESNIRQFALIQVSRKEIEEFVLAHTVIRHGFNDFVRYCKDEELRLVVVSSGLDLYINPIMAQLGLYDLDVFSAATRFTPDGIEVTYTGPSGAALTQGFKETYVRHFHSAGDTVIYIGDGLSDVEPAIEADYVLARSTLGQHFKARHLPHFDFDTFVDVRNRVHEIMSRTAE